MRAVKVNDTIRIYDSYLFKESIREIDGRIYDADDKAWVIPLTNENVRTLELMGATLDEELKARTESENKGVCEPIVRPKIKGNLYAHQTKAYNFALKIFEGQTSKAVAFLMDMGTGKTITTIALVGTMNERMGVNKLLVVCPKSIVGVWEEEFKKFAIDEEVTEDNEITAVVDIHKDAEL